ncbi:iron ABC transporter permease [Bacillus sp. J14TS2]|uniref:FecCD family ABC transporter permease n=1 Tax=Bacillus sp. J14TS2 TaxID=2807188 RepID=UPI001B225978|nr:iron ABC transporter permease [Bacillus sp. J14TS2]GIN72350.1 iron ABC transporter permease [Bacillus sp. J14TS2]
MKDQKIQRKITVMAVFVILIVIAFLISVNTGHIRLSPSEVIYTLFGKGTDKQNLILFDFRLPRIVLSILVGAALAISGTVLQGLSRNALADPGILGINAGAGLMVLLYVAFFPNASGGSILFLPILAWVGAAATATVIYGLSYKRDEGISPTRLLLTGIAVAAGISSFTIVITLMLSPDEYQFVATWMAGSIWGSTWMYVVAFLPFLIVLTPFTMYKASVLNILNMGDELASGLGVAVERERRWLLFAAVGLAGSAVSVSGGIGFVGLIAPHLVRSLIGPKHQFLLPTVALVGGFLVLLADTIGRSILQPSEVPAGIVVAVIGAPYFLYLLARSKT